MRKYFILLCLVLIASFGFVNVYADSIHNSYLSVRKSYFSLRNTDPQITRVDEWLQTGRELVSFAERYRKHESAASALYNAGVLYAEVYKRHKKPEYLDKSLRYLEILVQRYPDSNLADDALIKRGDIFLAHKADTDRAESSYLEVVEAYPQADLFEVAERKLRTLRGEPVEKAEAEPQEEKEGSTDVADNQPIIVEKPVKQARKKPANGPLNGKVIVIDPGHGGEDHGAVGKGGLLEKDVTLLVAVELEKLIEQELGATVRLTRRTDEFIPLAERTNLANDYEADLFISLHVNSSDKGKGKGFETYYLDNTDSAASLKLAERENASVQFEGPEGDLQFMLSDLIQSAKRDESIALANLLQKHTVKHLKSEWKGVDSRGVKTAPFYVLVGAHMPCVLVEMFFINNPQEGVRLTKSNFRTDIAKGMLRGIEAYFDYISESSTS